MKTFNDIVKSSADNRAYRSLLLDNKLKVLLISDPETDFSAASLNVKIGSMSDPPKLLGLAHFLEHMLFMGTKKFPKENEYSKYLAAHGGHSNAYTDATHTNFYFCVAPDALDGALDRFSQFFVSPLFSEGATDREVNAVHSEHNKNLKSDAWRKHQIEKTTGDQSHDFAKFGTGNKRTLLENTTKDGISLRESLLDFYDKWYSAGIMALAVIGKDSLDALSQIVVSKFSEIKYNPKTKSPVWDTHPYGKSELAKEILVVPIMNVRSLQFVFPIPDMTAHYKAHPAYYLAHLIGHEGPGSLQSELKALGLSNQVSAYADRAADGISNFHISLNLTEEGLAKVDDVITHTFQCIHRICADKPQQWIFDECSLLHEIGFKFKEKELPMSYVTTLSCGLHEYPEQDVITGVKCVLTEFKPKLIQQCLDQLVPEKMRIMIVSQKYAGKLRNKEPIYGTEYECSDIDEARLKKWRDCGINEKIHFKTKNEFIPSNLNLVSRETDNKVPELIQNTTATRVWFQQDNIYKLPKAYCGFMFKIPHGRKSALNRTATTLYVRLLMDSLTEYAYNAQLAGIHYGFENTIYGMEYEVVGYSDKLELVILMMLKRMVSLELSEERFNIYKEVHFRNLRNFHAKPLSSLSSYYLSLLTEEFIWSHEQLMAVEKEMTFENMKQFAKILFNEVYIETLIYGNYTRKGALLLADHVDKIFRKGIGSKVPKADDIRLNRSVKLSTKDQLSTSFLYNTTNPIHADNVLLSYYQTGRQGSVNNVQMELLTQILAEPAFNQLRTVEQLGYIVRFACWRSYGVQGCFVLAQSHKKGDYLDDRVEAFLDWSSKYLTEINEAEFQEHRNALITKKEERPKQLYGYASRLWREIDSAQYHFDRVSVEVTALKKLTKKDIVHFFENYIAPNAKERRKLSVCVSASSNTVEPPKAGEVDALVNESTKEEKPAEGSLHPNPKLNLKPENVTDAKKFKQRLEFYPRLNPYIDIPVPADSE